MMDFGKLAVTDWVAISGDDGEPLCVVRPMDPERAVKMAKRLVGTRHDAGQAAMDAMLKEQKYTFCGFAGRDGTIRDAHGRVLGKMVPGDSYVSIPLVPLPAIGATVSFGNAAN